MIAPSCTQLAAARRRLPQTARPDADVTQLVEQATRHLLAARLDGAELSCARILAADPLHPDGHHLLGMIAYQRRNYAAAVRRYRRAVALRRANALYHSNLGGALEALGKRKEAAVRYRRAIALRPGLAEAHYNLGNVLRAEWKRDEAIACYRRALELKPELIEARGNLGNLLRDQGHLDEALACYQKMLETAPNCAEAHANWGNVLRAQGRLDEAMARYRHAIALAPALAEAHYNLANILHSLAFEDPEKLLAAAGVYEDTLRANPRQVEAHYNLGCIAATLGDPQEALRRHQRAVAIEPHFAKARFAESIAQLQLGDLARGWANYEWRWKSADHDTRWRRYPKPLWKGQPLHSGKLLLWGEQGIGDEIQFAGLVPEVLATGCACVLDCDPRLRTLFARSFPQVEVVSGLTPDDPRTAQLAAHLPSGSLPGFLRASEASFAATRRAYLVPDADLRERLRQRYTQGRTGAVIGLSWHSRNPRTGPRRSLPLARFAALLHRPDIHWISLQYGEPAGLRAEVEQAQPDAATLLLDPEVDALADLDGFAAQIAAMDLVVTIDNSTAHLAGALGVPVWVLLPYAADWRWQLGREDSPWYPSMRLFRQSRLGDWQPVLDRVEHELDTMGRAAAPERAG